MADIVDFNKALNFKGKNVEISMVSGFRGQMPTFFYLFT